MSGVIQERCLKAQTAIIGSMLIDDRCIGNVLSELSTDDFPSGPHKTVFAAIKQLFTSGEPVDPVIVGGRLDKSYQNFLAQCMEVTPTAAHAMQYCEILRRDSRLLQLQDLGEQLCTVSELDTARDIAAKVNALMVEQANKQIFTMEDLAVDFYRRMTNEEKPEYLKIGFPGLDEKTYIELGDYVGIGAFASTGKTAFALQWAVRLAQKYRVGFFSLETNHHKAADRIYANQAGISLRSIKERLFTEPEWERMANSLVASKGLMMEFVNAHKWSVQDVVSNALSRRYQVIFIDYLQLLSVAGKEPSRYDIVTEASMTLHMAAQAHGITIVILSQLSRPEKNKGKPIPPDLHSFRESGQIEQDLDLALLMYLKDPQDYRSDRIVKIGKNKEGEKGEAELSFDGKTQTFSPSQKSAYSKIQAMGRKAKAEMAQIHMEEEYAAAEREGKQLEEVGEYIPF